MRDSIAMTKKERKAKENLLRVSIKEKQKQVTAELGTYKVAAKDVKKTADAFAAADKKYSRKANAKNTLRYEEAKANLVESVTEYKKVGMRLNALVDSVNTEGYYRCKIGYLIFESVYYLLYKYLLK